MTMGVRTVSMVIIALAIMGLGSWGHYTCGGNFGSATCAAGPPSLSGGGTGGSAAAAFAFVLNGTATGSVVGYTLNTSVNPPTLTSTANYTAPVTPTADSGIGMAVAKKHIMYAAFGSTKLYMCWTFIQQLSLYTV